MKLFFLRNLIVAGSIALLFVFYQPVEAQTSVGCSTTDLITAINTANSNGSGIDTLNLSSGCTYSFTSSNDTDVDLGNSALPRITSLIVMNGNGATITRGSGTFRLFRVESSGILKLVNVTVSNGNAASFGGGLFNQGTLTIVSSTISGNTGSGGVLNTGTLNVVNSTISGNTTTQLSGGGIDHQSGALTVVNSLITGNAATATLSYGGGIASSGGSMTVINSTVVANRSGNGGGGLMGSGTVTNSIIWGNSSQISGSFTITYSVVQGGHSGTGNASTDPLFVTLPLSSAAPTTAGNFQLQSTSTAINTGNNAAVLADWQDVDGDANITEILPYDRSNVYRILGTAVDKGAYETCTPYTATYTVASANAYDFAGAIYCGTTTTINLTNSTYSFSTGDTVNNDSALPRIASTITINGNGATIERNSGASTDFRLIQINSTGNLTMNNATIRNGETTGSGGGIYNENGILTVTDSTFSNNTAVYGGGIANWDTGVATISDSTFSNNTSTSDGGGIVNDGQMTVTGSTFSNNNADYGGGINNWNDVMTVIDSTFTENTAMTSGGGLSNFGTMTLLNSVISGNTSLNYGGGVDTHANSTSYITNTIITGNKATNYGGGLHNSESTVSVFNTTIAGNSAAIGGGIQSHDTTVTLANAIVWGNNSAVIHSGTGATTATYSIIQGGYTGTGNLDIDPLFVSQVDNSSAPTTSGDYHLQSNSPAIDAGNNTALPLDTNDVDGDSNTTETIPYDRDNHTRIQYTTVDIGADEVDYCPSYAFPYTVAASDETGFVRAVTCANANATADTINLTTNSTYTFTSANGFDATYGNSALPHVTSTLTINGDGATIERDSSADSFRLLRVNSGGNLTLNNVIVSGGNTTVWGGGLLSRSGNVTVTHSTFSGNQANYGGGIYSDNGTLTVKNSTFSGNSASTNGGGIHNSAGNVKVTNTTLSANSAGANGGGLYNFGSSMTVVNSTIFGNSAGIRGGGVTNWNGTVIITNSIISGNKSDTNGGGLSINISSATTIVTNSTIAANSSPTGGGIYVENATLTFTNSIMWGNSSGIVNSGGTTTATYNVIEGGYDGTGNLDIDPQFVSQQWWGDAPTIGGDYHIQDSSPVIDMGSYAALSADTADLDGDSNTSEKIPYDIDNDIRLVGAVDMGADEVDYCLSYAFPYTVAASDQLDFTRAVSCSNANATADTINLTDSDYTFTSGFNLDTTNALPVITSTLTINGNGATIRRDSSAATDFRLLNVASTGNLTLNNVTVTGGKPASNGSGGGLLNDHGTVTVTNSTFSSNTTQFGGGIGNRSSGVLTVIDSTFTGNIGGGDGGGIASSGQLRVTGSTFTNNTASYGGGISNYQGTATILTSTFTGNSANTEGGGVTSLGTLTLTNSIISGNTSNNYAGGLNTSNGSATVTNTLITGNKAANNGGGIASDNGTFSFINLTIAGNSAPTGGGIRSNNATVTLANNIIWGNSSAISHSGTGATSASYSIIEGGYSGTANLDVDPLFISYIDDTSAPTSSGDYHLQSTSPAVNAGNTAALPADTNDLDGDSNTTEAIPYDIDGNERVLAANVDIGADESYCSSYTSPYTIAAGDVTAFTSAISCANENADTSVINLTDSIYTFTTANSIDATNGDSALKITTPITINGNGATIERNSLSNFRILHVTDDLTLNDVTITGGQTSNLGGGIFNDGGTLTLTDSILSTNTAQRGGAIANVQGVTTITNSVISGNTATLYGGGIQNLTDATLTVTNSLIVGNTTTSYGSGIDSEDGTGTLYNTTISGNRNGVGLAFVGTGNFTVVNSIIWGNSGSISPNVNVSYSIVQGGYTGTGNLDVDPQFVNPISHEVAPITGGDYHLQTSSPAADKGSNAALPVDVTTDFDGQARIQYGLVDIGADEFDYCPSYTFPYTVAASDSADFVKAINCANVSADISQINLTGSTYSFTTGDATNSDSALPRITTPIIINGNSSIIERDSGASANFRLFYVGGGTLTLKNATVSRGSADNGGAVYNTTPGTLNLANVTVSGNHATVNGGAVYNTSQGNIVNTIVSGNKADGLGGGLYNANSTLTILNTTFAGNSGTGIHNTNEGTITVKNSIVWGNTDQIINNNAVVNVTYTNVEGDYTGTGNRSDDPLFVNYIDETNAPTTNGDYHLQSNSPLVNQGNSADLPSDAYDVDNDSDSGETLPIDIDGDTRVMDGTVEMGADEIDFCSPYASPYTVPAGDTASLINAITCANANFDSNIINLTSGTYTFTSDYNSSGNALPTISTPLTIDGNGAIIERSAVADFRLLNVTSGSNLLLKNVTLRGGKTATSGGAIMNGGFLTVVNSSIIGNEAGMNGGGVYTGTNMTFINTIVSGNKAANIGGGIYNGIGMGSIYTSTIAGNSATTAGGLYNEGGFVPVTNSIIYGNSSQIAAGGGTIAVTYSTVEGGYGGEGNQSDNPQFISQQPSTNAPTSAGDYHLQASSPAINKGSSASLPADTYDVDNDTDTAETLPIDIDGEARVQESVVDMGADEIAACSAYASPYTVPAGDTVSLSAAINCANASSDENIINLTANSIYSFTTGDATNSHNALPYISTPITINGNGAIIERSTSAVANFRLIYVTGTLNLNSVTLRGGKIDDGSGLYNDYDATLTITNSTISDNTSITEVSRGGGVYNDGNLTIINSMVSGNSAGVGGGISTTDGASTIINTTVSNNTAIYDGGGIFKLGPHPVSMINGIITGNKAAANGGGLYVTGGLTVSIYNTTIAGNSSPDGGGIRSTGTVVMTNSIVWGNSSQISNFATFTANYSLIEGGYPGTGNIDADPLFVNYVDDSLAPTTAGDYHIQTSSPAINAGSNAALPTDTTDLDGDSDYGETLPYDRDLQARIQDATVDMGADEVDQCTSYASPYTVPAGDTASLVVAIKCANASSDSNIINLTNSVYTFTSANNSETSTGGNALPIITTTITINGNGATLQRDANAGDFRLIWLDNTGSLVLNNISITGGKLSGILQNGAGIYNNGGTLTVTNSTISGNSTTNIGSGGGISNNDGTITVTNSTISGNTATSDGGAIFNQGTLTVKNSAISSNMSLRAGGVYNDTTMAIINSTISGNSATVGAGFYQLSSVANMTIINSTISGNDATENGGGFYVDLGLSTIINSTIAGNSAANGGGIYVESSLNLTNSIVWGNSSQITNAGGTITASYCLIEGGFDGTGNIDADPLFVTYVDDTSAPTISGDYRLQSISPAINAGNTGGLPADTYDLDGDFDTAEILPYDRDNTVRIEDGVVDMGAYEQLAFIPTPTSTPDAPTVTPTLDPSTPTSTPDAPTLTPEPQGTELLINGGFEIDIEAPFNQPDNWTIINKSKDKRKCNTTASVIAAEGTCAYLFKGSATENAKLTQKLTTTLPVFAANDVLTMSVQYKTGASAPRLKVKVRVFYTNTGFGVGKMNKMINTISNTGYTSVTLDTHTLLDGAVTRIKIQFHNRATSGKIYIDAASLKLNE